MGIVKLLEHYKKVRDSEIEIQGDHDMAPPENHCGQIRTLNYDFFRPISPMLMDRFKFCGAWKNAYLGQDWLSIQEINKWKDNKILCEWLRLRQENSHQGEPLAEYPMENTAIFSINNDYPDEIYLIWDEGCTEPKIWHYFESDFYTFNNFERFLLYINGMIEDEDTVRSLIYS